MWARGFGHWPDQSVLFILRRNQLASIAIDCVQHVLFFSAALSSWLAKAARPAAAGAPGAHVRVVVARSCRA